MLNAMYFFLVKHRIYGILREEVDSVLKFQIETACILVHTDFSEFDEIW